MSNQKTREVCIKRLIYGLNQKTLEVSIKRLIYGLSWEPGLNLCGRNPYLCPYDENQMVTKIQASIDSYSPMTTAQLIRMFYECAKERHNLAFKALS